MELQDVTNEISISDCSSKTKAFCLERIILSQNDASNSQKKKRKQQLIGLPPSPGALLKQMFYSLLDTVGSKKEEDSEKLKDNISAFAHLLSRKW